MDPLILGGIGAGVAALVAAIAVVALRKRPALTELDDDADAPTEETEERTPAAEPAPAPSPEPAPAAPAKPAGPTLRERFRTGFARTSSALGLDRLFGQATIDEALFESLEEALLGADVGVRTTMSLLDELRDVARRDELTEPAQLRAALGDALRARVNKLDPALLPMRTDVPHTVLVVGVNGAGKTTTIGKLAKRYRADGHKVLLGAGDTFRAGAIEQLRIWSERAQVDFVAQQDGSDAAAVLFDALAAAKARGHDVVLCDTAGRLQAKKALMQELGKVTRVVGKAVDGAPHEVLLVLDGTMGQNALSQAKVFTEVTGVTGLVLTKLDGTAKGGVVVAVMEATGLPVKFVGIGEGIDDLRPFDGDAFVDALLGA